MQYLIGFVFGFLMITACGQKNIGNSVSSNKDSLVIKPVKEEIYKKKKISFYSSKQNWSHWEPNHADNTNYECEVVFKEEYAIYWYHGQCAYYYFTNIRSDSTVELLWSYKTDCILNMDFLEKSNGIRSFPKKGDSFATYTLVNDSTLKVKYRFLEWAQKINQIAQDSIFPTYFYLKSVKK